MAFPYLPGSESPAFQGLTIFVGALFTLGSSGAIANLVAGIVLIYSRAYTLGYDVPWRQVHEVLIKAASETDKILQTPEPFVLQTSLDDFYVSYELNAYTDHPKSMSKIFSELHQNLQDACNENNIEILSPHYGAMRDGNELAVPEKYWPPGYEPTRFRLDTDGDRSNAAQS